MVGISDPLLFNEPKSWADLDGTWQVGASGGIYPGDLERIGLLWCDTTEAADMRGRTWRAPVILTEDGGRAFRVAYGRDWLPALTPEQARAEKIAQEARTAMASPAGLTMQVACQWAAELLCVTYHLCPEAVAATNLLDDALVIDVLCAAVSKPLKVERP